MYDRDIRAVLVDQLTAAGVRVVQEWSVGNSVVDVAAIAGGKLYGYEIKSPRDSLARFGQQVPDYSAVFDRCVLVSTVHYLDTAEERELLPDWWGTALALEDETHPKGVKLLRVREAKQNPAQRAKELAWLMYARECRASLQRRCLPYREPKTSTWPGYHSKPRMVRTLAERLTIDELRAELVAALLARPHWKASEDGRRTTGADTITQRRGDIQR